MNPHPALSPVPYPAISSTAKEQGDNETKYRQLLVQGALAVLLPTEDLDNACLRTIVADVIADSILGNSIGGRACEGWYIWAGITRFLDMVKARIEPQATGQELEVGTRSRLEKFGLLAEKNQSQQRGESLSNQSRKRTFSSNVWRILQYFYMALTTVRFVVVGFAMAYSQPSRLSTRPKTPSLAEGSQSVWKGEPASQPGPIVGFGVFALASALLDLPSRMPWVSGSVALLQHHLIHGPFRVGATGGILDQ